MEPIAFKPCTNHPDKKAEVRGMCRNCRATAYYHTHPKYQQYIKDHNKKMAARGYFKEYRIKNMNDPIVKLKRQASAYRTYHKHSRNIITFKFLTNYYFGIKLHYRQNFGACLIEV